MSALILSCVSEQVRECNEGDWFQQGYVDAMYGKKLVRGRERQASCKALGYDFDDKKYKNGYSSGLKKFCKTDVGYDFGLQGQVYLYTCGKSVEAQFLTGYWQGRRKFLHEEIKDKKGLIQSIENDLEFKQKQLLVYKKISKDPTHKILMEDVSKLAERKRNVASEISKLSDELSGLEK